MVNTEGRRLIELNYHRELRGKKKSFTQKLLLLFSRFIEVITGKFCEGYKNSAFVEC
jgi:hypothetical protein